MPLFLDTQRYTTRYFAPLGAADFGSEPDAIASFLRAVYSSLGLRCDDAEHLATQWCSQPKHASFLSMTQALLSELNLPDSEPLVLVLFCHWSSDCEIGHSISNYIIEQCNAHRAFAFAISEAGPVAPFVAYDVINKWSLQAGSALLVTMDQSSHMHPSTLLSDHKTDNIGAAMLWSRANSNGLLSGYHTTSTSPHTSADEWVTTLQAVCPFDLSQALILTDVTSRQHWSVGHVSHVFADSAPSAWPFHLAQPGLTDLIRTGSSHSGLVLCRTYRGTMHLLWFYPETPHENH